MLERVSEDLTTYRVDFGLPLFEPVGLLPTGFAGFNSVSSFFLLEDGFALLELGFFFADASP